VLSKPWRTLAKYTFKLLFFEMEKRFTRLYRGLPFRRPPSSGESTGAQLGERSPPRSRSRSCRDRLTTEKTSYSRLGPLAGRSIAVDIWQDPPQSWGPGRGVLLAPAGAEEKPGRRECAKRSCSISKSLCDDPVFATRLYECRLVPCSKSKEISRARHRQKSKRIKVERALADPLAGLACSR
jgi:hypothetical protein